MAGHCLETSLPNRTPECMNWQTRGLQMCYCGGPCFATSLRKGCGSDLFGLLEQIQDEGMFFGKKVRYHGGLQGVRFEGL